MPRRTLLSRATTIRGLITVALVAVSVSLIGCGNTLGSPEYLGDSKSSVLVPEDERFRNEWFFYVDGSPDNYAFRSNWELKPPRTDGPYDVQGYQLQDPTTWTPEAKFVNTIESSPANPFVAAIVDSQGSSSDGPCESVQSEPEVVRCEYTMWANEPTVGIFVRRFESTSTTMLVGDDLASSLEYIAGEFDEVPLTEAAEQWFASTDYS